MSSMPAVGTVEKCAACGRTVWLKKVGTVGFSDSIAPGAPCYQWCARKGSKPAPITCPAPDGYPTRYHKPHGRRVVYYGESPR